MDKRKSIRVEENIWEELQHRRIDTGKRTISATIGELLNQVRKNNSPSANGLGKGIEPSARGDQHGFKYKSE